MRHGRELSLFLAFDLHPRLDPRVIFASGCCAAIPARPLTHISILRRVYSLPRQSSVTARAPLTVPSQLALIFSSSHCVTTMRMHWHSRLYVRHGAFGERIPVPREQGERDAIAPAKAHLRSVLAATATEPGRVRRVLFKHKVGGLPRVKIRSNPTPCNAQGERVRIGSSRALKALDNHLLKRRPRIRPVPLLRGWSESGSDAAALQQSRAAQRLSRELRLPSTEAACPQWRPVGSGRSCLTRLARWPVVVDPLVSSLIPQQLVHGPVARERGSAEGLSGRALARERRNMLQVALEAIHDSI
mmetsp:Transcript_22211/g.56730  ORF Transcript_22211/g.56730 Transcript_22211/m.56730 type:complete len:302 (-) Transcript_22211:52-957(-)